MVPCSITLLCVDNYIPIIISYTGSYTGQYEIFRAYDTCVQRLKAYTRRASRAVAVALFSPRRIRYFKSIRCTQLSTPVSP